MLELICLITNQKNDRKVKEIYKTFNLTFNLFCYGTGSISKSGLKYFGLEDIKRYIYFSIIALSLN